MSLFIYIIFAIAVYRQASGRARYHKAWRWIMYGLTLGTILPFAYFGYQHNPKRNVLKFKEVL